MYQCPIPLGSPDSLQTPSYCLLPTSSSPQNSNESLHDHPQPYMLRLGWLYRIMKAHLESLAAPRACMRVPVVYVPMSSFFLSLVTLRRPHHGYIFTTNNQALVNYINIRTFTFPQPLFVLRVAYGCGILAVVWFPVVMDVVLLGYDHASLFL